MQRFEGKVAIVAGGGRGIGAETARRLASEGAAVVVGDIIAPITPWGGESVVIP